MTAQPIQFDQRYTAMKSAPPVDPQHAKLVATTEKWVAQTFYGQMLKQMRNSPFKSDLFEGGRGGQAFNEMFDQHMAEHMARGAGSKLVKAIVRKVEAAKAYRQHAAAKGRASTGGGAAGGGSKGGK